MLRRVVIFDDDPLQASALREQVGLFPRQDELEVESLSDLAQLRKRLVDDNVDILLMDIHLEGEELDGIEFVRRYVSPHSGVQVIFVTKSAAYHSSVYRAPHMGFLLKPVQQAELDEALTSALAGLKASLERPFLVHTLNGECVIVPHALRYAESRLRKVELHIGDEIILVYGKLSDLLAQLPDWFIQCHKSFVVNMGYIEKLGKSEAVLTTGEHIPVSQKRRAAVRSALAEFIGRGMIGRCETVDA